MSRSAVDYENLMETSFSDANTSVRTGFQPRWERKKQQQHFMLQEHRNNNNQNLPCHNGDRFIPNRAAMNMDVSKHLMRSSSFSNDVEMVDVSCSTSFEAVISDDKKNVYASNLSSALLGVSDPTQNRIISYTEKAPAPQNDGVNNLNVLYSAAGAAPLKKSQAHQVSRSIPSAPSRILDAPDLMDDYYLNLVAWSDSNVLAVALGPTVYLWNAGTGETEELCTFEQTGGRPSYISSVAWVQQGGTHLAVGTSSGATQLWDVQDGKQVRSMDGHGDRIGALAWNRHVLSSGSRDTTIVHHDVRIARHQTAVLSGHTQEVCGLAWNKDGETLASGGNDNLLCLWDVTASSQRPPRHQLTDHQAAVKALAWSPHDRNLLATGGGTADRCIKFWTNGILVNSIDTGSQVCALQWNPYEKEILSSHGFAKNQLCLWKYPSMAKIKELEGHTSRVLHMACSPDGGTVVSAAGDETLRFWDIFCPPSLSKGDAAGGMGGMHASSKQRWTMQIR